MSAARFAAIVNHNVITKKIIPVFTFLIALTLVSFGAIATHASFNDKGTSAITATSGQLSYTVSKETVGSLYIHQSTDLLPNQTRTFKTTVTNTGTIPMKYFFTNQGAMSTSDLTSQINLQLKVGTAVLYNGKFGNMGTASNVRTLQPGASEVVDWTVTWPYVADVNSNFQGTGAVGNIVANAIQ